jgi:hypothetical protein
MQGHQARLAEFGTADGQHCVVEIDIIEIEVACFTEPQTRDAQQPEQTMEDPGPQCTAFIATGHFESGIQEAADVLIRVQVRSRSLRLERQQTFRRNLRASIGRTAITCKSAYEAQSLGAARRLNVRGLLSPGKCQRLGDVGGAALLHEGHEIVQSVACLLQLETQRAPHAQILSNGLPKGVHCAPPGHGKASVRKAWISTLA